MSNPFPARAHPHRSLEETHCLLSAARAGCREALDSLLHRIRGDLQRHVRCKLPSERPGRFDRSDLVQESLVDAVRALDGFEPRGSSSFRAWLARIAENRVRMALRDQHRLRRDAAREVAATTLALARASSATSPSHAAARTEEREHLERALARLPADQALAIRLARFEELPLAVVAARLARSENAVKKLLARGLIGLRAELTRSEEP